MPARWARVLSGVTVLCAAAGVALNCVWVSLLLLGLAAAAAAVDRRLVTAG